MLPHIQKIIIDKVVKRFQKSLFI